MTTILVVDDAAMDRRLASGILEKHAEWDVVCVNDGQAAIEYVQTHHSAADVSGANVSDVDVIVTDLHMPRLNGLELVDQIRADFPLIPVVLMTSQGSEEIAVKALQQGAANYVPKHLLADELVEAVQRVLTVSEKDRSYSRLLQRLTYSENRFELESDLELTLTTVQYLKESLTQQAACSETEILRVGVALEEALLNAYYHGNMEVSSELRIDDGDAYYELAKQRSEQAPYCHRKIFVQTELTATEAIYVIRDEGPGFSPEEIPDATDPANLEKPCGRGLLLIQTFMDEVRHNKTGNEITMTKRY